MNNREEINSGKWIVFIQKEEMNSVYSGKKWIVFIPGRNE